MIVSEVQAEPPEVQPGPEVLAFGPPPPNRRLRRRFLVMGLALAVALLGLGVWRLLPKPPPDFTLADLQGAYSGMVRSDGTNDVSTVTRDKLTEARAAVSPATCLPVFDYTLSNQFPTTALDGVSTYWSDPGSDSIAMATYRYENAKTAKAQLAQVRSALASCVGVPIQVAQTSNVFVAAQDVVAPAGITGYVSYLLTSTGDSTRFTVDVAQLDNSVTWQYRYYYHDPADYSPVPAQQLMTSLMSQLEFISDSHR
jgi:hypothetical protein